MATVGVKGLTIELVLTLALAEDLVDEYTLSPLTILDAWSSVSFVHR